MENICLASVDLPFVIYSAKVPCITLQIFGKVLSPLFYLAVSKDIVFNLLYFSAVYSFEDSNLHKNKITHGTRREDVVLQC